jgi:hypothetical protein
MVHSRPATESERLAAFLTEGAAAETVGDLARELGTWLAGSTRFRAFADGNRDKIRKKLRGARDTEAQRDVRAELRLASLLLADRRIDVAFEPYGAGRAGPDLGVRFRSVASFNVEVTRLRHAWDSAALARPLLAKLRQLPPSVPNALAVAIEHRDVGALDVAAAVRGIRERADRKDEAFFVDRGFPGSRGFYDRFLRLGAVFLWSEAADGEGRASLWTNGSARIAVPPRAARACLDCLRAADRPGDGAVKTP